MKHGLSILFTSICILAVAAGCLKKASYLDRMAALEKQSCACADKACAEKAFSDFLEVGRDMKKEDARFDDEGTKKLGLSTATIIRCVMMKGVSPVTVQQELQKLKK